ncbi:Ig-like domain-containing protein, partial [Micromonospora sp. NPDC048843]|uniref:Ig-like domain-containing protein n=1 Tax=Micromonospora sp. NPDC048843 TaxID=3155389 RepID=UPI0033D18D20
RCAAGHGIADGDIDIVAGPGLVRPDTRVVPLRDGAAVVELPTNGVPAGVYPVHVAYSGDRVHAPSAAVHQRLRVR